MQLTAEVVGDVGVVCVDGEVDAVSAPDLYAAAGDLIADGARSLVIDIGKVDFIASDGLWTLVRAFNLARANGGTVTVRNPTALAYRLIKVTRLDEVLVLDGGDRVG
jgi:anti-sigma B factor antagonist